MQAPYMARAGYAQPIDTKKPLTAALRPEGISRQTLPEDSHGPRARRLLTLELLQALSVLLGNIPNIRRIS